MPTVFQLQKIHHQKRNKVSSPMRRNDSRLASHHSLFGTVCEKAFVWRVQLGERTCVGVGVSAGSICPGASTGAYVAKGELAWICLSGTRGGVAPRIYPRNALYGKTFMLSSCKISVKANNPRPSYSNITN